jgi:hypothetical protein
MIYRRLPAFLIATLDKFEAVPSVGEVGAFFGRVERADDRGFYGPGEAGGGKPPAGLLPPLDLVIEDELHLISGPLGSMAGLYETTLETRVAARSTAGGCGRSSSPRPRRCGARRRRFRPCSIARARRYSRRRCRSAAIVSSPRPTSRRNAHAFLSGWRRRGTAPLLFLRAATTLSAAGKAWDNAGGLAAYRPGRVNPADPDMTTITYFNALRERLGTARRIVEDEIRLRASRYG